VIGPGCGEEGHNLAGGIALYEGHVRVGPEGEG
jgi:hypothetical protein